MKKKYPFSDLKEPKTNEEIIKAKKRALTNGLRELTLLMKNLGIRERVKREFRFSLFIDPEDHNETCLNIWNVKTWEENQGKERKSWYEAEFTIFPSEDCKEFILYDWCYYEDPGNYWEPPSYEEKEFKSCESLPAAFLQIYASEAAKALEGHFMAIHDNQLEKMYKASEKAIKEQESAYFEKLASAPDMQASAKNVKFTYRPEEHNEEEGDAVEDYGFDCTFYTNPELFEEE